MKTTTLIAILTLLALTGSAAEPRKISQSRPQLTLSYAKGMNHDGALLCLMTPSQAVTFEVQRKSGRLFRRWRTVGFFNAAANPSCWTDVRPPAGSRWRVRAIGADGGRSAFSEPIP